MLFSLRMERVEQMIFQRIHSTDRSKLLKKIEMNDAQGTGKGNASSRNTEPLRTALSLGWIELPSLYTHLHVGNCRIFCCTSYT